MALSDPSACAYSPSVTSTADLSDGNPAALVCGLQLRQFGGLTEFSGPISTVRCLDDNVLLRQQIEGPGNGRVLVVDGGGSLNSALVGDLIAGIAAANGWVGFVLNAGVRDTAVLKHMPIGIKALGSVPRRSVKEGVGEVDVPVDFGGITFTPGAILTSDDDGIVVLHA
jgi:regulator of ribonuclease activity A